MHEVNFLAGGGEMGQRIRELDWNATALGAPVTWPASLRTAVRLMLGTHHPVFIFWGATHLCLYNDSYRRSLGDEKHPAILGTAGVDAWPEIWPIIHPQIELVMAGDGSTWHENQLVPILRHGHIERVYWTYSYSPIHDDNASTGVGGVIVLCNETTEIVLAGERAVQSESRYRALAEHLPGGAVFVVDADLRYVMAAGEALTFAGLTPDHFLGRTLFETLDADISESFEKHYRQALAGHTFELEHRDHGRHFLTRGVPLRDHDGGVYAVLAASYDITARKESEQLLQETDRLRDEFLAVLAHELRNPLAPVRNAAAILQQAAQSAPEIKWCSDVIERQVRRMAYLLDDLMDVARIKQGRLRIQHERVAIATVISSAIESARPMIDAQRHSFTVDVPVADIFVHGDPVRLAQVVANLLDNAAKYTPEGGSVSISALRSPDVSGAVDIQIRDTGIGVREQDRQRIFGLFTQVGPSGSREHGGLGVGLALVSEIVRLHGGSVRLSSAGEHEGSIFTVTLPAFPDAAEATSAGTRHRTQTAADSRFVLIVDDNADAGDSLSMYLTLKGFSTDVARSGREAIQSFGRRRPDIAILDIGMTEMDGYELAGRIRELPGGDGVVLAALTGWGQTRDKQRATDAGFQLHFTKPIDMDELVGVLLEAKFASPARIQEIG